MKVPGFSILTMRRHRRYARDARQRGVAVITALLLTTLAVTIVASLFWQQQVQVRSIENQRLQLQKQWILRGALDWAKLILQTGSSISVNLQDPWAAGLAETRLDAYVENGRSENDAGDATISGQITDAQSRLNLYGLSQNGQQDDVEIAAYKKLLGLLGVDKALAESTARAMAATQGKALPSIGSPSVNGGAPPVMATFGNARAMPITQLDDLLDVPGYTPAILARLKKFVIILPSKTSVNVNTTSAEVLSARVATLSLAQASVIVAKRNSLPFRDRPSAVKDMDDPGRDMLDITSQYFLVNGKVRLDRAVMEVLALTHRNTGSVRTLWIREN
jgi:general secretion pathway protein K